jgi:positive regulator of sigma E activity
MELDDFKTDRKTETIDEKIMKGVKADSLQELIDEMKERDKQENKVLLYIILVFGLFVVLYLSGMNVQKGAMRAGYAMLAGGFGLSLLFFLIKFLKQKKTDYTAPTLVFLRDAERRYAYWTWQELVISCPLLVLMGWGGDIIVTSSFEKYFPGSIFPGLIFIVVYIVATAIGYWAGKRQWEKSKRAIYEKIRRMRQEFGT